MEILKTFPLSYHQKHKIDHWQTMVTLQFGRQARFGVLDTTSITSVNIRTSHHRYQGAVGTQTEVDLW